MALPLRYLTSLVVCSLLAAPAAAQTTSAPPASREVHLRFTVFALNGLENLHYAPRPGQPLQPVRFYSAYRSPTYRYAGPARIHFFTTPTPAPETPPAATYDIPENARDLLLVFFTRTVPPETAPRLQIVGINDSPERLPAGSFTTVNFSGRDYVAQLGSQRLAIPQGLGSVHPAKGRITLLFATRFESTWLPSGRHDFTLSSRDRVTLLLFPPATPGSIYPVIRRLVDTAPAPGPELAQDTDEE